MKRPRISGVTPISQSQSQPNSHSLSDPLPPFNHPLPPPSATLSVPDDYPSAGVEGHEVEEEEEEYEEEEEEYGEENEAYEEEEKEGDMAEDVVVEASATAEQRQKFADGFYEVEAIRKKRICKGEPQYLIKWRGWPESANTWEPIDHLQTCPDVVEAYEERLRSEQKRSSRKRKRKFTQPKKKMQYSYGVSKSKISPTKMTLSSETHRPTARDKLVAQPGVVEDVVGYDVGTKPSSATHLPDCNGFETISLHLDSGEKNHGALSVPQNAGESNLDVHFQQNMSVEGNAPANLETGQDNQRKGAKRRKSSSVRRFTQEMSSFNLDFSGNSVPLHLSGSDRVGQPMLGNSDAYRTKKSDTTRSSAVITKLIKPISFSASVTNNIQDASVTFAAMRSDGKEVMVDNKFLKANNPLLLINFYEQHLRYNPNI